MQTLLMSTARFKEIRRQSGLSQRLMGIALQVNAKDKARTIRAWENGENAIPVLLPMAVVGAAACGKLGKLTPEDIVNG